MGTFNRSTTSPSHFAQLLLFFHFIIILGARTRQTMAVTLWHVSLLCITFIVVVLFFV